MNHVDKSEVTEPPIPTMDSPTALPTESTFNTGYLCEEPNGFPVGKVKIRSRYSYNKSQEPAALDTVESISMDDIRTMGSDLAAQRLHVLASQIDTYCKQSYPCYLLLLSSNVFQASLCNV